MSKPNKWEQGFVQGYFCACSTMVQQHGNSTEVEDCVKGEFKSVEDLKRHGVDEFDIKILTPTFKEIIRKNKP